MSMFTKDFWKAVAERSLKTGAQAAGMFLISNGTGLIDTDWIQAGSMTGMAMLLSVLTSMYSDAKTGNGPSLTNAEVVPAEVEKVTHDGFGAPIVEDYSAKHDKPL